MGSFDETYDFVVVGSGGGGMCAALKMAVEGRSVQVLEKTELLGGSTARSGGTMWIPNNPFMERDGVADSLAQAEQYLDAVVGDHNDTPGASRTRRRAYLAEAPRMIGFLLSQGVKLTRAKSWPDYYDDQPGGSVRGRTVIPELFDSNQLGPWKAKLRPSFLQGPMMIPEARTIARQKRSAGGKVMILRVGLRLLEARLTGKHWVTAGESLQGQMLLAATRAGASFRTGAPVTALIEEKDRLAGVVTTKDGQPWRVGARMGVLVNAGGFAKNQAMRDRYQPGTKAVWSNAAEGDTGEMIEEMMRLGAAIAQMEEMVGNQTTIPPGTEDAPIRPSAQSITASPHAILVDQTGVRYLNEGGSYMAYCKTMYQRNEQAPAVPSWAVFDTQFMDKYMLAGTMAGRRKPRSWSEQNYLRKGGTLEELAQILQMEPAKLAATVDRFNRFVAINDDQDFGRGKRAYDRWLGDPKHQESATLGSLTKAPFYAVPVVPADVGTFGGVLTDAYARVLRPNGSVIRGLYATGVSTASVMGRFYPGAGSSVGPSFTFGYVAASHALSEAAVAPIAASPAI